MVGMIRKGDRVRACKFQMKEFGTYAIAGAQMKAVGDKEEVVGVVHHIRTDDPTNPVNVRLYVTPDGDCSLPRVRPSRCTCHVDHVEIEPEHVVEVL